jgi:hypothetical protein
MVQARQFFSSITPVAILAASLGSLPPASARPFIYFDTYSYTGGHQICAAKAKKALEANGFKDFELDENQKERYSDVTGYLDSEPMSASIGCNQKLGISTLVVSGLDNDSAFKMYELLNKADW